MTQAVESIAGKVLSEHGIMKGVKVEEVRAVGKPSFEAFTELSTSQTTIKYNPDFIMPKGGNVFAKAKNVTNPLEACIRDIARHECGHISNTKRRACPENLEQHEEHFYEPVSSVLKPKGKLGAVDSITNLVEDVIDNSLLAKGEHAGLSLFYKDVANTIGWEPAYDAFMRIQLYCWGDREDRKMLTQHFTNNPEVVKATQSFLRKLESLAGRKGRLSHEQVASYFSDSKNWKTIAKEFTKALLPLIPPQLDIPMCGFGKQAAKEMQDPSNREKFARKNYSNGKGRPGWMDKEEALDAVYTSLAREIQVLVDEPRKAMSMPLVPYNFEPFNPEEHGLSEVNFRRPLIVPESETPFNLPALNFGVAQRYVERPLMVKKGITSFPEFKAAYIDCSGTMKEGIPNPADAGSTAFIPWGDKSKYHYLCKAWYGIVEYLARQGILPNVQVALGSFSSSSRVRHGLEDAKRLLFNPQWGDTQISNDAVAELLNGDGKSVFFTVSDGEVQNWSAVKEEFIGKAKQHYYFHIQIGPATQMTRDLASAKLPVYAVKNGEELESIAVDLTRNAYESYIGEVLERLK